MYCCGPTVYNYAHIGNLRTYLFEDLLRRAFEYNNYKVKHVMNITDVGHLTSDADTGEDKMLVGAKREKKSVKPGCSPGPSEKNAQLQCTGYCILGESGRFVTV